MRKSSWLGRRSWNDAKPEWWCVVRECVVDMNLVGLFQPTTPLKYPDFPETNPASPESPKRVTLLLVHTEKGDDPGFNVHVRGRVIACGQEVTELIVL